MKFYDEFLNLFGKECVVSDEIKLDKSTLDLDHMVNEGDFLRIPFKLKLNNLKNYFDLVEHTNESADLGLDECWCDDYDEEKSFISLSIDFESLSCSDGDGIGIIINIIPPVRTQKEIDEEVQNEKESENRLGGYDCYKVDDEYDGKPIYYWEQLRNRLMDEKEWRENHSDKDGRYSFYQVDVTQDVLDEIFSIPEIKKAYDKFNNAFPVKAVG